MPSSITQDHASIPLIYLSSQNQPSTIYILSQEFILNPKAIQHIQSHNNSSNQTTFISICGDYRSGKSFLMNSLFFSKQGFKVSPTTQPCTKGINLWSKPMTYNGKNIWILDTQGFGAIDRDDSYDVKIFLLSTLISDVVMYNSFGALDQNTINKFAAICHKAESLDKGIKKIKMFWILRDFSLSIQNKEGRILTADQYLQSALDDGLSTSNQRQAIKRVFGQRHCIPLVRPVIDETILSQLSQIKFQQLRGEFVQQVYKLRKKLLSCIESKVIEGVKVDGENLGMFLNKYVQVLNQNEVQTDISSTWEKIIEYEKQKQEGKLMGKVREILNKQVQKIPFNSEGLYKLTQQSDKLIDQQLKQLQKHFTDKLYIKQTQQSMTKYIDQSRDSLITKNMEYLKNQQKKCVKSIFDNVQKQVGKQSRVDDNQLIQKYLERLFKTKDQYMYKYSKYLEKEKKLSYTSNSNSNNSNDSNNNNNNNNNNRLSRQSSKQLQSLRVNQLLLQSTQLIYYEHFYQQQKLMFPKIVGQLSQQLASTISKMNQTKKIIKSKDIDIKHHKQQQQKLAQQLNTITKQLNTITRQLTKLQLQKQQLTKHLQLKHHQVSTIATKSQNQFIKIKQQYEQNIEQLKQTILSLQKQFLSIQKQNQLQQLQYKDKLQLLNEKNQLLLNKIQQSKLINQKAIEQLKQQYEQKVKKQQQKYQQIQNSLNQQRKKFLQLNKNKKQQQSELLQDLAEKNQRLLQLRREMTNIQHIYKQQLDSILIQQRRTLQQQYYLQLQQKQHLIHVLEQKLQQCIIRIQQLQQVQKKYQTLLMEHRLLSQQHLNVIDKYKEIVNKLKRSCQTQQQKDTLFEEIKQKYQLQLKSKQQLIKSKQQLLRKLKLQIKSIQQQTTNQLQQLQAKHLIQQSQTKQQQQEQYEQKLRVRLSQLQSTHRLQKQQLLQQVKQGYNEIQGLKSVNNRLEGQYKGVRQVINRMRKQFITNQKDIKQILRKYKKLQKQNQQSKKKKKQQLEQQKNVNLSVNDNERNNITNSQFDKIPQNMSLIEQSSIIQQQQQQQESVSFNNQLYNQQQQQQTTVSTTLLLLSRQSLHQLQSQFTHLLHSNRSLTQQLQDLKHSFKQTISQLQQCQSHINKLNQQINKQQQQLNILNNTISQLQQTKKQLHQKTLKLQSLQKSTQLLKKQVQLRDEIYIKRESSIKQNLQLYKQTIANLTQQNQHLTQKSTKLQIQLHRFTQWQADLTIYNSNNNNNNKSKSNIGSYEFITENMQQYDQMYSFGDRINKLQRENRKLKKQLNQQKQLTFNNSLRQPSSTTNLTNILTDNNFSSQIQSLKKQNQLYKKRVQQLRQRQLKLLEQMKTIKVNQKQSTENKVNLVRQQFESYRKKSKEEIVQLEKRVDQLTEQKYRLKQQMLLMRQEKNSYHMYSGVKTMGNGNGNSGQSGVNNNAYSSGDKTTNGYMSRMINTSTNNNNNFSNNTYQQQQQLSQYPFPNNDNNQIIQSNMKTIQTLKQQNTRLHLQLTTLKTQLIKLKDQSDKKLASLQIFYQQQIRTLQNQKSRLDLQNQKNKTKYQHLLKVNNQLILEVDNFKAKANNSLTLKEKYKHKISALFNDD